MVNSVTIGAIEYEELVRDSEKVRVLNSLLDNSRERREEKMALDVLSAVLGVETREPLTVDKVVELFEEKWQEGREDVNCIFK